MNLADANFQPAPCMPCGSEPPTPGECACALLIPLFNDPYADYATAETAIADGVVDCVGYMLEQDYTTFSVSPVTANAFDIIAERNLSPTESVLVLVSVSMLSGSSLTVDFDVTSTGLTEESFVSAEFIVYSCEGDTLIQEFEEGLPGVGVSGTFSGFTATADGVYFLQFIGNGGDGSAIQTAWTVTADDTIVTNPVIALWDDSGTTRQLEACPKLYLPPLTESTGDWYADCAAADAVLTDALQVSNCVGFNEGGPGLTAFTATDGGTSLTLDSDGAAGCSMWGSVNCESAATVTVAGTTSTSSANVEVFIYDYTGTLVEDSGGAVATPFVSAALPYPGRYIIKINVTPSGGGAADVAGVITSSDTMSVNEIQALYDTGLGCPARLNCGDSCP